MQRYMPTFFQAADDQERWAGMKEDSEDGDWYERKEVDARIEQLERALQSCVAVIKAQRAAVSQFGKAASNALVEADTALMGS